MLNKKELENQELGEDENKKKKKKCT